MNALDATTAPRAFTAGGHSYEVRLHPAREGAAVVAVLLGLGLEPLGRIADSFVKSKEGLQSIAKALGDKGTAEAESILDASLSTLFEGIDLTAVGGDLRAALATLDLPGFAEAVFRYTMRDGKMIGDHGDPDKAHGAGLAFDKAFAGNYGEFLTALYKVANANNFFGPLSTLLGDG